MAKRIKLIQYEPPGPYHGPMSLCEQAVRRVLDAAIDIENREEHPLRAARDIQTICYAALEGREVPDIFAMYPKKGSLSGA
jgi:hypothetical protein